MQARGAEAGARRENHAAASGSGHVRTHGKASGIMGAQERQKPETRERGRARQTAQAAAKYGRARAAKGRGHA